MANVKTTWKRDMPMASARYPNRNPSPKMDIQAKDFSCPECTKTYGYMDACTGQIESIQGGEAIMSCIRCKHRWSKGGFGLNAPLAKSISTEPSVEEMIRSLRTKVEGFRLT